MASELLIRPESIITSDLLPLSKQPISSRWYVIRCHGAHVRLATICGLIASKFIQFVHVKQVTLYHWDLPQALENLGGWLNSSSADWFEEYSRLCYTEFGNDVNLSAAYFPN